MPFGIDDLLLASTALGAGGGLISAFAKNDPQVTTGKPVYMNREKFGENIGIGVPQMHANNQMVAGNVPFTRELLQNFMSSSPYGRQIAGMTAENPEGAFRNFDTYAYDDNAKTSAIKQLFTNTGPRPEWLTDDMISQMVIGNKDARKIVTENSGKDLEAYLSGNADRKGWMTDDVIKTLLGQKKNRALRDQYGAKYGYPVKGAMASGGRVRSGGNYLVGEQGPEIVSLPRDSYVTPNPVTTYASRTVGSSLPKVSQAIPNNPAPATSVTGTMGRSNLYGSDTPLPNALTQRQIGSLAARAYEGALKGIKNRNATLQTQMASSGNYGPNMSALLTNESMRDANRIMPQTALATTLEGLNLGTSQYNNMMNMLLNGVMSGQMITPPLGSEQKVVGGGGGGGGLLGGLF
jgi:hypothetical protein